MPRVDTKSQGFVDSNCKCKRAAYQFLKITLLNAL